MVDRNGEGQEMKSNNKFEVGQNRETKVQRRTKQGCSEGVTVGDRRWAEQYFIFRFYIRVLVLSKDECKELSLVWNNSHGTINSQLIYSLEDQKLANTRVSTQTLHNLSLLAE